MSRKILGIHHVTAIAGEPQKNIDFYTGILGLRLVKLTVNYDDPDTYHLYYGDALGRPGTILTFFPWPGAHKGRRGAGQVTEVSLCVPRGALEFWKERLSDRGTEAVGPFERFGEEVLVFSDPSGLKLELVTGPGAESRIPRPDGPVAPSQAIRGIYGVAVSEEGYERTASLLTKVLGFHLAGTAGNRFRFEAGPGGPGAIIDVLCLPSAPAGQVSVGSVHHVAWRTAGEAEQRAWQRAIAALGFNVTPVIDRTYFRSIYFREPGGVLFEIATDHPGFTVDEPAERLGTQLMLPPGLEPLRPRIEMLLPRLRLPEAA